ncbi:MAG: Transcriptional regulator [Clostridiales bacterium 38_11]|nr:MAG: Transcriptional regulator [Clostridiales bacterium 38_11]
MASGSLLKKFRELRGLTQKSLGAMLGFDDSRIRQYESGKRNPKGDILKSIANALKVNPEYLDDDKYPYSMDESVRLLFKMEDLLPVKIQEIEVLLDDKYGIKEYKYALYFSGEEGKYLDHFLRQWQRKRIDYEANIITQEQYEDWKANWPESVYEGYTFSEMNPNRRYHGDLSNKKHNKL